MHQPVRDDVPHRLIEGDLAQCARQRMRARDLSLSALGAAPEHGRIRGAAIYAIGRREVARLAKRGEGVQLVCSLTGVILTVYGNPSLRGLRSIGFSTGRQPNDFAPEGGGHS